MLAASFKSWVQPAHLVRACGRNAVGSSEGNAAISRYSGRLGEFVRPRTSRTSTQDLCKTESGRSSDQYRFGLLIFPLRICESFQRFYSSCLLEAFVEAWKES
jgi:hypothetical protein